MIVHTIGHGTLEAPRFVEVVRAAGVDEIVDVRTHPGSRHNPQYARAELERWLPEAGLGYLWQPNLGGRRRPVPDTRHVALRNRSFQAYADHMDTGEFRAGIDELVARGAGRTVMCSESLWWRCHRRLIADHLVIVRGVEVVHLMHDGRHVPHRPTEGVRHDGERLTYDLGVTAPLPEI